MLDGVDALLCVISSSGPRIGIIGGVVGGFKCGGDTEFKRCGDAPSVARALMLPMLRLRYGAVLVAAGVGVRPPLVTHIPQVRCSWSIKYFVDPEPQRSR